VKIVVSRGLPTEPGQLFGLGVTVGVVVGLLIGSIFAVRLGEEAQETIRYLADRLAGRRDRVNFELLLQ
jgi:gas vesicle protein